MRPEYPYEARKRRITGSGVVVMHIDRATGNVTSCFKPGPVMAKCPITFTMSGQGNQVFTEYHVKEKSMDEALAGFLGKGTVERGPIPAYPGSVPWTTKQGNGRYELHVRKDGRVSEVKVLKRSGDDIFDRATVEALRKWRLRRGPLILDLPLSFSLTPTHYSVAIPKTR